MSNKFCSDCGFQLAPESQFCGRCGVKIVTAPATSAPHAFKKEANLSPNLDLPAPGEVFHKSQGRGFRKIVIIIGIGLGLVGVYQAMVHGGSSRGIKYR